MAKKRLKLKYKRALISLLILIIALTGILAYFLITPNFSLESKSLDISLKENVNWKEYVKVNLPNVSIDDVEIDASQVDNTKLGKYEVLYSYKDETKILQVEVVDKNPPEVNYYEKKTMLLNDEIRPEDFIKDIADDSKTEVSFANNYSFNQMGEMDIVVFVTDEYKNRTEINSHLTIKEADTTAPVISVKNISVNQGTKIDLLDYVTVTDDHDKEPKISVDKKDFDYNTIGTYTVTYTASDKYGNIAKKDVTATVKKKEVVSSKDKVIYLTFDDGPSKMTPQVLDILAKYNVKATFFVTGNNASYRKYIKIAHDQGHTIGLHTYSHNYAKVYASTTAYFNDLTKVGELVKKYIGYVPKYIRFPGGSSNAVSKKYSKGIMTKLVEMVPAQGYEFYDWNASNGDGTTLTDTSKMFSLAKSSQKQIMMLMHDANGKQSTVDVLPKIIQYYQDKGYTFKAIDDSAPAFHHSHINN